MKLSPPGDRDDERLRSPRGLADARLSPVGDTQVIEIAGEVPAARYLSPIGDNIGSRRSVRLANSARCRSQAIEKKQNSGVGPRFAMPLPDPPLQVQVERRTATTLACGAVFFDNSRSTVLLRGSRATA